MTGTALVLLLLVIAFMGWKAYEWYDARTPPAGVEVQDAVVTDLYDEARNNSSSSSEDYVTVAFRLEDGEEGSALYENRWFGEHEEGDAIRVYREGEKWRTTSEVSPSRPVWTAGAILVLLVMVGGWFRVRRRDAERADAASTKPTERRHDV